MENGQKVKWTSNKGKERRGVVKTLLTDKQTAIVEMQVPPVVYKVPVKKLTVVRLGEE